MQDVDMYPQLARITARPFTCASDSSPRVEHTPAEMADLWVMIQRLAAWDGPYWALPLELFLHESWAHLQIQGSACLESSSAQMLLHWFRKMGLVREWNAECVRLNPDAPAYLDQCAYGRWPDLNEMLGCHFSVQDISSIAEHGCDAGFGGLQDHWDLHKLWAMQEDDICAVLYNHDPEAIPRIMSEWREVKFFLVAEKLTWTAVQIMAEQISRLYGANH